MIGFNFVINLNFEMKMCYSKSLINSLFCFNNYNDNENNKY